MSCIQSKTNRLRSFSFKMNKSRKLDKLFKKPSCFIYIKQEKKIEFLGQKNKNIL